MKKLIHPHKLTKLLIKDNLDVFLDNLDIKINAIGARTENYEPTKYDPHITLDYQFIYVINGYLQINFQEKDYIVNPNELILIPAFCVRKINGLCPESSYYTWIHFNLKAYYMNQIFENFILHDTSCYHFKKLPPICQYELSELTRLGNQSFTGKYTLIESLMNQLIIHLVSDHDSKKTTIIPNFYQLSTYDLLNTATEFIEKNIALPLKVTDIAKHLNVSESYLYKIFIENTKISPNKYIQLTRARTAALYIKTTSESLSNIASMLGFTNYYYFSRFFKKWYAISPRDYRNFGIYYKD